MKYDKLHAYIDLLKRQRKERELFLAQGINDEAIQELFRADYRQLYRDASFYYHLTETQEGEIDIPIEQGYELGLMDSIENPVLHKALLSLSSGEMDILISHAVMGESLKDIAARLGKPEGTVRSMYARIRTKVKKFF